MTSFDFSKNPHCEQLNTILEEKLTLGILPTSLAFRNDEVEFTIDDLTEAEMSVWSTPFLQKFLSYLSFISLFGKYANNIAIYDDDIDFRHVASLKSLFAKAQFFIFNTKAVPKNIDRLFFNSSKFDPKIPHLLISELDDDKELSKKLSNNQKASLIKFSGDIPLDGSLLYRPYNGKLSSSTYLIPNGYKKKWDNQKYLDQMKVFNLKTRALYYPHEIDDIPNFDHCYDCAVEVSIWKIYLNTQGYDDSESVIRNFINQFSRFRK